ncbi:hypothetical protein ACOMHN_040112 [Nucella lapillus]
MQDELDAMFDQFVENHAGGDAVKWLSPLLKPCTNWSGLSLAKPIDLDLRDRVKHTLVSLLEFRNYLFCRQAALLFAMGRAWEVAERAFDFLRNTVIEMKSLKVELPEGALQCWVVLSGLEVLAGCGKQDTGQVDRCSIFTAHLWDHIRAKLKEVGELCSLMPGKEPTSNQLNHVLDLKGGMAVSHDQGRRGLPVGSEAVSPDQGRCGLDLKGGMAVSPDQGRCGLPVGSVDLKGGMAASHDQGRCGLDLKGGIAASPDQGRCGLPVGSEDLKGGMAASHDQGRCGLDLKGGMAASHDQGRCGLPVGSEDLKGGMAASHDQETVGKVRPVDKLHEALSTPSAFKKHYLEMCELAMGTYKHISRFRSSRKIGRELASFYMNIGEPQKAEAFLLDAVKMYRQEGWHSLAHATMRDLAACQKHMGHTKRFLVTACKVSCSGYLPDTVRSQHFQDVLKGLEGGDSVQIIGRSVVEATQLRLNQPTVRVGEDVTMTVHLHSRFPGALTCDSVHLALSPCLTQPPDQTVPADDQSPTHSHASKTVAINTETLPPSRVLRRSLPAMIATHALYERRQGRVVVAGIQCDSAHELLKRTDSVPIGAEASDTPVKGDYGFSLSTSQVVLSPGGNEVQVAVKQAREEGWFMPSQLCVKARGLEMLVPLRNIHLHLHVASLRPSFTLTPRETGEFIAGIKQSATLTVHLGSEKLDSPTSLILKSPLPITFTPTHRTHDGRLWLRPQGGQRSVEVDMDAYLPLEDVAASEGTCLSVTRAVECCVDGWSDSIQGSITFVVPLSASHRVYTARNKKYLQVQLEGNTTAPVTVAQPDLSATGMPFTLLNPGRSWVVRQRQAVSLVWEVSGSDTDDDTDVHAFFTCHFSCHLDLADQRRSFTYTCHLSEFQTWYMVEYTLSGEGTITAAVPGTQLSSRSMRCPGHQSGITYAFYLTITPVNCLASAPRPQHLVYRVTADPTIWAFSGKTTGVLSIGENPFRASLKVIPLAAGYQHLPSVNLYYHSGTETLAADDNDDIWVKRAEAESPEGEEEEESCSDQTSGGDSEDSQDTTSGLHPFSPGRVYNASLAKQVHVFPTPASSDMEVSMENTAV